MSHATQRLRVVHRDYRRTQRELSRSSRIPPREGRPIPTQALYAGAGLGVLELRLMLDSDQYRAGEQADAQGLAQLPRLWGVWLVAGGASHYHSVDQATITLVDSDEPRW